MLIVELTYKRPESEAYKYLEEHRAFLDEYYANGVFLASGVKVPRDGGIIVAVTAREHMEKLIQNDPFYQHGIAEYKITEFIPSKCCEQLQLFLEKN